MFENVSKTTLDTFGEFNLIQKLTSVFEITHKNLVIGNGDDSAVYKPSENLLQVVSSEILVENVNFDLMYTPLKHLGYKSIIAAISDIYAMNAIPKFVTISIAASSKYTLEALEDLYAGIYQACKNYDINLIGGDTNTSPKGLTIAVTAIGEVSEDLVVGRNGCKPNDLLCVSGDLGGAFLGHKLLEREKRLYLENPEMQPDLEGFDYIVSRQLKPEARKDIIALLNEMNIKPTSMIDLSDGLASDLKHIALQSGVGFDIYEDKLPIDPQSLEMASEFNLDATTCVLNGGEDFELLFTIPQSEFEKIKSSMDITIIGHATELPGVCKLITPSGNQFDLTAQGWGI